MKRVKDITLYDCGRANTTDLWLQCVHHNYRAGLYKHDTAGAQSSLDWIFFLILSTKSCQNYLLNKMCQAKN